jgi:hypothetical protein
VKKEKRELQVNLNEIGTQKLLPSYSRSKLIVEQGIPSELAAAVLNLPRQEADAVRILATLSKSSSYAI